MELKQNVVDWKAVKQAIHIYLAGLKVEGKPTADLQLVGVNENSLRKFWVAVSNKYKIDKTFQNFIDEVGKKENEPSVEDRYKAFRYKDLRAECIVPRLHKKSGELIGYIIRVDPIVEFLIEKYNFKTIFYQKAEIIFTYSNGIYVKKGRADILEESERILQQHCKNNLVREIEEKIKRKTRIEVEDFNKIPLNLICLENGIYDLGQEKFIEFNPNYYFKTKIHARYVAGETCPKIDELVRDILYEDDVPAFYEFLGSCLYRKDIWKKSLLLFGATDTGKTQLANVIINFIGRENMAGLSLQKISAGKGFDLITLENKYLNLDDDLSEEDVSAGGFKKKTGGINIIHAEHKFFDGEMVEVWAKNCFTCNVIPGLKNKEKGDPAFFIRWLPMPCDNMIPVEDQKKDFANIITTEKEMSGLLNMGLAGLKKILKTGRFSYDKTALQIQEIMERHGSDTLHAFVQDVLFEDKERGITKEHLSILYDIYARENKLRPLSKDHIGKRLRHCAAYIVDGRQAGRFWGNVGINLNLLKDKIINDIYDTFFQNNTDEEKKSRENKIISIIKIIHILFEKASYPSYKKEIRIQFLRETPQFMAEDSQAYGGFGQGDQADIPPQAAERLIARGYAIRVITT